MAAGADTLFTVVCAANDREVLQENLLASPCIAQGRCACIVQEGYRNVPRAYNQAAAQVSGGLVCFVHQDVRLPKGWGQAMLEQLVLVEEQDPAWGMVGCAGAAIREEKKDLLGYVYDGCTVFGGPEGLPAPVDTLDELALICRKQDAVFDEGMPNYHLFGAELCLRLRRDGRRVYAINAYCHHNSPRQRLTAEFAAGCGYLYAKYPDMLPIATTCVTIARVDGVCVFYQ